MFCAAHNAFYFKEDSTFSIEHTVPRTTLSLQNTVYGKFMNHSKHYNTKYTWYLQEIL